VEVKLRERTASQVEDLLGPNDGIVFRCLGCQEYFLPREYHVLKKTWRAKDGYVYSVAYELCPACYPEPHLLTKEEDIDASGYAVLTKTEFLIQRRYEKAGIIPPGIRDVIFQRPGCPASALPWGARSIPPSHRRPRRPGHPRVPEAAGSPAVVAEAVVVVAGKKRRSER